MDITPSPGRSSEAGAAGGDVPRGNGNQNVSWSTARSSRKAPNRCLQGEAATTSENATPRFSINMQKEATEEGQHRKSKQIKTSASACATWRDSTTTSSSKGCAKRRKMDEQDTDGNLSSKKCKRMSAKAYLALFKLPSTTGPAVKNAKQPSIPTKTKKIKESPFQKLQRLPNGCHLDFDNDHLFAVNKLREFWHKSQGACLVDDKEIVMKTVLFIMSLLPDVCQPFLIVTTTSLSLWEAEFKRFAPFINVVVYDGGKEMHKSIQDLKFNTSGSSMRSHVFLASPDAILEDIETVQCTSWEAVIVEYCQNSVLKFLKQLKQLHTDCRIVLLRSPPEDNFLEYKNLVAFLSSEEEDNGDYVDDNALAILKAKFTRHIAYDPESPDEQTNKGRKQGGKTGEIVVSSSKSSSDVSNNDVPPGITPPSADIQPLDDARQKIGVGNPRKPKSLHVQHKREFSKLIKVLELPDNVRFLAEQLLEYLLKNHLVLQEPRGLLNAFNIALCWCAASLLKYNKLDHRDSLALAATSLNYENNEELAQVFYKKLATLRKIVRHKPYEISNEVVNDMFSPEEGSSANLRHCHMLSKQATDLHGNLTNSSPQESSSGVDQIVSDGQVVFAPEVNRKCHFSSRKRPNMIIKKRLNLFDKVFSVRKKNIHEKQQLEILEFQTYRENQVIKLKDVCSLVLRHIQQSCVDECSRNDQTNLVVEWFTMLLYAFLEHMRLQLNKLEALQSRTWFKEQMMKEKLKEEVVSGQSDQCLDLCTALPDSSFVIEEFIHFKEQNDDYHAGRSLASDRDQLLDDRLIMEITLLRNTVPSEAISTRPVGNEPEAPVSSGRASASESVYLPENNIIRSSDGTELQRGCSSTVPERHGNQLSSVPSQHSTDASPRHQPVETESTGMLGKQVEQDLRSDTQPSTSLLDVPPQMTFTGARSQAGFQLDSATDMSEKGETEYSACATHDLTALSLSREAETDNGQKSVHAQQSKSSRAQESLAAFQHPLDEAESAGTLVKSLPDDMHQSTSVQYQTAEVEPACMLGITEARDLQHEIQPSMTTHDVPLERADLSGMLLTLSTTVMHGVEPSGDLHAEPSGTLGIAAPALMPEIPSSSSMQDGPVGAERPGTSGIIATQILQPLTQPSVSVQHIPPEGTHSNDMVQTTLPGQQSTGLNSEKSMAASWHPAEQEEPAGMLGVVVADAFQPSTLMLNRTTDAERAGSLDAVSTCGSHTELLPSSITHDVPCAETDLSGMPVQQDTTSQQILDVSGDTHAEREPENAFGLLAAHDLQSGMQSSSSVEDQLVEAERAGQSDTIVAQDLQSGTQPSTEIHHITPERTHHDERIQISQPNETPSQTSLQPNEAPCHQLLTQFFSEGPAAFNHLIYSSEPLRNELEKVKYCTTWITKIHEQKILLIQAEYNKELEKLNRKYGSLFDKEGSTYHQVVAQLQDISCKVSMHQLVAENFHEKLMKRYASQEISASPTTGQVPQTCQQAPTSTSGAQTTASLVGSLPATQPPVLTSFHSTGALRSEAIQLQPTLHGNLYRATAAPPSSRQQNGSHGAAGAQLRGPAPHLRMPQPYATVHRDHQQVPVNGPGFTSPRHPAPGVSTSPRAGLPLTSISSSSVHQTMAPASNSHPALPAPSLAELMGNFVPTTCSANPVVMAGQQVNLDAAAGIWHTGGQVAGVANPVPGSALERLAQAAQRQRWHAVMAGSASPSMASRSGHPPASNSQPARATNPLGMAGQRGPSPNPALHNNNSVPVNDAAAAGGGGIWRSGTHIAAANQACASMDAWQAGRTGASSVPTSAGVQAEVVCLSDDE